MDSRMCSNSTGRYILSQTVKTCIQKFRRIRENTGNCEEVLGCQRFAHVEPFQLAWEATKRSDDMAGESTSSRASCSLQACQYIRSCF